jgi:hypothetical protein
MSRGRHELERHDAPEIPEGLSVRDRLEWEVAQLADGTLSPQRRGAVEAALLADAELRGVYESHRRVGDLLREPPAVQMPDLSAGIMQAVRNEPAYGATASPRRAAGVEDAPAGVLHLVRDWWVTIGAVAAALVVGLYIGNVAFGPDQQTRGLQVGWGGGSPAAGNIEVAGPVAVLRQQQTETGTSMLAVSVSGPDYRDFTDPQIDSDIPEYVVSYGASAVVETSGQMVVASVSGEMTE